MDRPVQTRSLSQGLTHLLLVALVLAVLPGAGESLQLQVTQLGPGGRGGEEGSNLLPLDLRERWKGHGVNLYLNLLPVDETGECGSPCRNDDITVSIVSPVGCWVGATEEGKGRVGVSTEEGSEVARGRVHDGVALGRVPLEHHIAHRGLHAVLQYLHHL